MPSPGPEVIILFCMLNSAEHEILTAHKYQNSIKSSKPVIYLAYKCLNENNCRHFNIYEQDKY